MVEIIGWYTRKMELDDLHLINLYPVLPYGADSVGKKLHLPVTEREYPHFGGVTEFYGLPVAEMYDSWRPVGQVGRLRELKGGKANQICGLVTVRDDAGPGLFRNCDSNLVWLWKNHLHPVLRQLGEAEHAAGETGDLPLLRQKTQGISDGSLRPKVVELLREEDPPASLFGEPAENTVYDVVHFGFQTKII